MYQVEFWFDPACPWAWRTSLWAREVGKVREISLTWHLMSLAILNEGLDLSSEERALYDLTWSPVRVCAAAARSCGQEGLGAIYLALGRRIHEGKGLNDPDLVSGALRDASLPLDLATAGDTQEFDDEIRASHESGQKAVGMTSGTPITAVDGVGFHGPVISRVPKGEEAGRLFDGVVAFALTDGFSELSRARAD